MSYSFNLSDVNIVNEKESENMINSLIMKKLVDGVVKDSKKGRKYYYLSFFLLGLAVLSSSFAITNYVSVIAMGLSSNMEFAILIARFKEVDNEVKQYIFYPLILIFGSLVSFSNSCDGSVISHVSLIRATLTKFAGGNLHNDVLSVKRDNYQKVLNILTDNSILSVSQDEVKKDIYQASLMPNSATKNLNNVIDYYAQVYMLEYIKKNSSFPMLKSNDISKFNPKKSWLNADVVNDMKDDEISQKYIFMNAMGKKS